LQDCRHEHHFEIRETDTVAGFLSFTSQPENPLLDSAFDCGHVGPMMGEISQPEFKCNVTVRRADWDSTVVQVMPFETAQLHISDGDRHTSTECNSTGRFEHRL